ncbi:hypothetical protein XBO1_1900024 [Xenorhabdus bovienii str. oregonense]|uniref:Uncharacterized protein n=1 Tax=Xenorhabdus bovienii str. oregonense TaxID=1398202 RepID=A0A077NTA9_XENBV|nr:hypothetical protein XBO1_1900024 [Xenorhabdus bovienii str. oregonense]
MEVKYQICLPIIYKYKEIVCLKLLSLKTNVHLIQKNINVIVLLHRWVLFLGR